jgi:hypothetical protein
MTRITLDLRYVEMEYELWALGHMLAIIEPAIERLAKENESDTLEALKRAGWDQDEAELDLALQEVAETRDFVLPRFMRGPFVLALWACFESAVEAVARTLREETGAPISLDELRGNSFLARARHYFEAILEMPLEVDKARDGRLTDLSTIRNALAHSNGLRVGMSPDKWRDLGRALARQQVEVDSSREFLVLSGPYLQAAYSDVRECLHSLVNRARLASPPPARKRRIRPANRPANLG